MTTTFASCTLLTAAVSGLQSNDYMQKWRPLRVDTQEKLEESYERRIVYTDEATFYKQTTSFNEMKTNSISESESSHVM